MANQAEEKPVPSSRITKKRRFSPVWIAPALAAFAVAYMVYDGIRHRGPMITVVFEDAEGIVAGKSPIKYEGVQVGTVEEIRVDLASGHAILRGRLQASAHGIASDGTQFWIQHPEISLSRIASLETLISGPYVACYPGTGARQAEFVGLEHRPPVPASRPGLRVSLNAEIVSAVRPGSPVLFRGIEVGEVDRIGLTNPDNHIVIDIYIEDRYAALVRPDSNFWEVCGLQFGLDLDAGLVMDTQSLRPAMTGAIAFYSPSSTGGGESVIDGTAFTLIHDPGLGLSLPPESGAATLSTAGATGNITSLSVILAQANRTLESLAVLVENNGDLDQTLENLTFMSIELKEAASGVKLAMDSLKSRNTIEQASDLVESLNSTVPELVDATASLGDTLDRVDMFVRTNGQPLADTIESLRSALKQLDALLEDLRTNPSQLLSEPPSRDLPRSVR